MPRINVEECLWSDPRLVTLSSILGSQGLAIGELVRFWRAAQEAWLEGRSIPLLFFKKHLCASLIDAGFAEIEGDFVRCNGAEEHFGWILKARESGKLGGIAAQLKRRSSEPLATVKRIEPSSSSSFSSSQEKKKTLVQKLDASEPKFFLIPFWEIYPRKEKKMEAREVFRKIGVTKGLMESILKDILRRRESDEWTREDGRYIPLPSSYLNQRRWQDEGTQVKKMTWQDKFDEKQKQKGQP